MIKKIAVGLIATAFIVVAALFIEKGKQVYMAPHVQQFIKETSHLPSELVGCLQYEEVNGDVFVYDYYMPKTYKITKQSVRADRCAPDEIHLHNHPYQYIKTHKGLQDYYRRSTGTSLRIKDQMLYLSSPDLRLHHFSGGQYFMVSTNGKVAWWSKDQLRNVPLLTAKDSQIIDLNS